jgi:hypothetical protein
MRIGLVVLPSAQMVNTSLAAATVIRLWSGSWKGSLQVACDRLRCHPVFKEPRSEEAEAEAAYKTCQKYVWNATTES